LAGAAVFRYVFRDRELHTHRGYEYGG